MFPKLLRQASHSPQVIFLSVFTILQYGLNIQPILFNDDWCFYYRILDTSFAFNADRRPLHLFLPWLLNKLLPPTLYIKATYLIIILTTLFTAILLYYLLNRLLGNRSWFTFIVVLLTLTFPNDYTRLYAALMSNRVAFVLLLIAFVLYDRHSILKTLRVFPLIVPLLISSLLIYEAHLGIAIIWPLLYPLAHRRTFAISNRIPRKKIIGAAIYYSSIGGFIIWRLLIQPQTYNDPKLSYLHTINIQTIIQNYARGMWTIFAGFSFPFHRQIGLSTKNTAILIVVLLFLLSSYRLAYDLYKQHPIKKQEQLRSNCRTFVIGLLLWVAGYFPIILNFPPNIYGHLSRVNIFSIPGASIMIFAAINAFFSSIFGHHELSIKSTIITGVVLSLIGSIIQIQVQDSYNASWTDTKLFYSNLFTLVPNVKDDTHLVLLLSGYEIEEGIYRPLYSSSWEAECAIRTLYDNDSLSISYRYERRKTPDYPSSISLTSTLETDTTEQAFNRDPQSLLVLQYDNNSKTLSIIHDIQNTLVTTSNTSYTPENNITSLLAPIPARELVTSP